MSRRHLWGGVLRPRTIDELRLGMELHLPGLRFWLHNDPDGSPWLQITMDFTTDGRTVKCVRLDHDAHGARGGWSVTHPYADLGIRAEAAGVDLQSPDSLVIAHNELQYPHYEWHIRAWFKQHRDAWPHPMPAGPPTGLAWAACTTVDDHGAGIDLEHAINGDSTLCGIPRDDVVVWRHLWRPRSRSCPMCTDAALAIDIPESA